MIEDDSKYYAPDAEFIEALAQAAIASLPTMTCQAASVITLKVQDFISDEHFEELGLEDPYELSGLYQSVMPNDRLGDEQRIAHPVIWLFRRPILDEWSERGNICLADLVKHVLVQELAHHFDWDDRDIAALDPLPD